MLQVLSVNILHPEEPGSGVLGHSEARALAGSSYPSDTEEGGYSSLVTTWRKDYDRSWDWKAPENAPKLIGKNLRRVLSDAADPSPCARLLNETVDESIERMTAESDFRDP